MGICSSSPSSDGSRRIRGISCVGAMCSQVLVSLISDMEVLVKAKLAWVVESWHEPENSDTRVLVIDMVIY